MKTSGRVSDAPWVESAEAADAGAALGNPKQPTLSLIIPAYNESARIAETTRSALAWLRERPYVRELIVVDDGSDDDTAAIAGRLLAREPVGRVLRIPHGGKAVAVRAGMLAATGDQVAFSDADLATPLASMDALRLALAGGADIAIGTREGAGARRIGEPVYRHVMGRVFNGLVRALLIPGVHDTQCGFKLFRAEVARDLVARSRLYPAEAPPLVGPRVTAFDVELLTIARLRNYRVASVPVVWTYGAGSKVRPAHDTWHNLRDVFHVWVGAKRGNYQ